MHVLVAAIVVQYGRGQQQLGDEETDGYFLRR
jgi:hypothetical protein